MELHRKRLWRMWTPLVVIHIYTFGVQGYYGQHHWGATTSSITNKNGGQYTATVQNNRTKCVSSAVTVTITNTITLPALTTSASGSTNCIAGKENGLATLATVDAAAPNAGTHTFQWYNGVTAAAANIRAGDTGTSIGSLTAGSGLPGWRNWKLYNSCNKASTGCQNTAVVNIPDNKTNPVVTINLVTNNTNCLAPFNGSLSATVDYQSVTDTPPLAANWTVTWKDASNATSMSPTVSALAAGTYSATVLDSNTGCVSGNDTEVVLDVLTLSGYYNNYFWAIKLLTIY